MRYWSARFFEFWVSRKVYFLTGFLLLLGSIPVVGHEVRPAFLQITEASQSDNVRWDVVWKQPIVENKRLPIKPVFADDCKLTDKRTPEIIPGAMIHRWTTGCDLLQNTIHIDGLSSTLTDVLVRIDYLSGVSDNYLLRAEEPTLDLNNRSAAVLSYLLIGIEHLLLGLDHILLVIGLVFIVKNRWSLLKTITAFTVAHSLTLAIAILGWIKLNQGSVEIVIALSIVFLARELIQSEKQRSFLFSTSPWVMAFILGLLHGLGFAGALSDIGLPADALWLSLLLFNLGIELGQLLIITAVIAIGWLLQRFFHRDSMIRIAAYSIGCIAMLWTLERTLIML